MFVFSPKAPPSAVHNEMVPITTSTTVTLTWERATSDRSDVSYAVSFSDPISGEFISYDDNIEDNGSPVTVTVTGLMPYTLYSFRITASNGVSDMDPTRAALREVEITATTTEGRKCSFVYALFHHNVSYSAIQLYLVRQHPIIMKLV